MTSFDHHVAEAERLLGEASAYDVHADRTTIDLLKLSASQVHATLANALATTTPRAGVPDDATFSSQEDVAGFTEGTPAEGATVARITGEVFPLGWKPLGSAVALDGALVWHVCEVRS